MTQETKAEDKLAAAEEANLQTSEENLQGDDIKVTVGIVIEF